MAELFDDITRVFGSGLPRRRMLQLLAGVFAGGALPALWPTRAAAFVPCAQPFTMGAQTSIFVGDCETLSPLGKEFYGKKCSDAAYEKALIAARPNCITTCPQVQGVQGTWIYSWSCSQTDPSSMVCAGTGEFSCHCDAPAGKNCCGIGNYCTSGTQKCCGTFCGPIGQPCPNNPSPSR